MFNFIKTKHGEVANFIRNPKSIFANFYICKKTVKTLFFCQFSMEKGPSCEVVVFSRGVFQKNLVSVIFHLRPVDELVIDVALPPPASTPDPVKDPKRKPSSSSLAQFPPLSLPVPLCSGNPNPNLTLTRPGRRSPPLPRPLPRSGEHVIGSAVPLSPSLQTESARGVSNHHRHLVFSEHGRRPIPLAAVDSSRPSLY